MVKKSLKREEINTDAKSFLKGFNLQLARVVWRMLQALQDEKKCVFFTVEHSDDVLEVNECGKKYQYVTEQNKEYARSLSMNSEEIKNTLRIFFDNWCGICESSESIQFVFYTNASIAKEDKVGVLKNIDKNLPDKSLIQLLIEKDYDSAFPFVIPIFKEYYVGQHRKHEKDISSYEQLCDSMTNEEWKRFFDLIEWNFGEKTAEEIWKDNQKIVQQLCAEKGLEYSDSIIEKIIGKLMSRVCENDFLERTVHISEIENLFIDFYRESTVQFPKHIYPIALIRDDDHGKRFKYDSNLIHLSGRKKEMQYLHDFCNAPDYLSWTAIYGEGGVGKTRLAYEFCKNMEELGWQTRLPSHASEELKYSDLDITKFSNNILICWDYVKYSIEDIESYISLLGEKGQFEGRKIRIILIERSAEDFDDLVQMESAAKEYLYLPQIDDKDIICDGFIRLGLLEDSVLLSIVHDYIDAYKEHRLIEKNLNTDDEGKILKVLSDIGREGRLPLYALFVADAWCEGEPLDKWNKETALQYVMGKELRLIKNAAEKIDIPNREKTIYQDAVKCAIALATYVKKTTAEDIYKFIEERFAINRQKMIRILEDTHFLLDDGEKIIAMKPDLIGEYWCARTLNECTEETANLFFEFLFNNYFFDTVIFSDRLYKDYYMEMLQTSSWWENIERIKYPENLTYVKKNIFKGYPFIKSVILHNRITRIEAGSFRKCENLETIVFPSSLETIGPSAFSGCKNLISALPSDMKGKEPSIITIQDNAFKGCESLTEVIIPESVTSIGRSVFEGCKQLKGIDIPRKVNSVESCTFANCSELEKVNFLYRTQSNEIALHSKAFWHCKRLYAIGGTDRISHIGEKAFSGCECLPQISFSSQLSNIGVSAFSNCTGLKEVEFSDCNINMLPNEIFYSCDHLESVHLPGALKAIGEGSFYNCHRLVDIKIPAKVKRIGRYAFGNCISIKLELPHPNIDVMDHAISGCKNTTLSSIKNIPGRGRDFCGFVFSSITEKEIDFLTSYEAAEEINVPDSVEQIDAQAFYRQKNLKRIQIPKSVTTIGDEAFKSCHSLVEVDANLNSITKIGQGGFEGCTSLECFKGELKLNQIEDNTFKYCIALKSIIITNFLKKIGKNAFAGCVNLKIIFKRRGIISFSIGNNAFLHCEQMPFPINLAYLYNNKIAPRRLNLYGFTFRIIGKRELKFLSSYWNQENVVIPGTCIWFEGNLFSGNRTIKTIHVPQSILELPEGAFSKCHALESINLPPNLKTLPSNVFLNCESLKQFTFDGFPSNTIPDNVIVEKGAFFECSSLIKVTLPSNLKVIRKDTFHGCRLLQEIDLPEGLTHIEEAAFQLCAELKTISIPGSLIQIDCCAFMECKSLRKVEGLESSQVEVLNNDTFKKCTSLETVHLPENLHCIGAGVFSSCHSLRSIDLPRKLDKIGKSAFQECYKLQYIRIPRNVTRIEKSTFKYCSSLQEVDHFHSIEYIGTSAFYICSSLRSFRMPRRVARIGVSAFAFCHRIKEIEIPDTVHMLPNGLFETCTSLEKIELPNHIKCIPANCFKDCKSLADINLPTSLERIGAGAFSNCLSYNPLDLPDTLVRIDPSAFRFCGKLSEISLPASINDIAVSAFAGCVNLKKVEFTAVKQVDNYAFSGCINLSEIPIQNIEERIGIAAFQDCTALEEVSFSETISVIDSAAFRGCSCISRLTLPPSITEISGAAFRDNTALAKVNLPETLESIKKSAFRDCINLETVEIKSERIEIAKNVFRGCKNLFDLDIPANSFVMKSAFIDCPMGDYILAQNDIEIIDDEE